MRQICSRFCSINCVLEAKEGVLFLSMRVPDPAIRQDVTLTVDKDASGELATSERAILARAGTFGASILHYGLQYFALRTDHIGRAHHLGHPLPHSIICRAC